MTVAVEGDTDLPIVRKVLGHVGLNVGTAIDLGGKDALDLQLRAYLRAAAHSPWFILRDLDLDAQCAPELLASLAVPSDSTACVRIAVRAMEAWLLADAESISSFLGVRLALIPTDPDFEADPKGTIVALPRVRGGPGSNAACSQRRALTAESDRISRLASSSSARVIGAPRLPLGPAPA